VVAAFEARVAGAGLDPASGCVGSCWNLAESQSGIGVTAELLMAIKRIATDPTLAVGQAEKGLAERFARVWSFVHDRRISSAAWIRSNPFLAAAMATGLIARIVFWIATDRRLDDALITIKFDKNLADGFGFVHNLGEGHVQGFTSALSVLVPLPGELIAPGGGGFVVIRLVSLGCFLAAMVYADRISATLGLSKWPTRFVLAYLALDPIQVYFGVVGMETQIAVAVLLAGIFYVLTEDHAKSGVALGLAILARPDFVLWVGPALIYLVLRNRRGGLRSASLAAAIVAPWVIFTTVYYGSPIPNTIVAKSAAFAPTLPLLHPHAWLHFLHVKISQHTNEWMSISPFYEKALVLRAPIANSVLKAFVVVVVALAIVGAVRMWSVKSFRPAIAYVLLFEAYKVIFLTFGYYDWYGPPAFAVLMIIAAAGLDTVCRFIARALPDGRRVSGATLAAFPAIVMAAAYAVPLPFLTVSEARIQHVEDTVRTPLGRYLGEVVKTGQTFTSESSGYVGWYTNATLYDFPGLESPRVAHVERAEGLSWADNHSPAGLASPQSIAYYLRPDWLVLRPGEWADFKARFPATSRDYRLVKIFGNPNAPPDLDVGGMIYWSTDQAFVVLRRTR
jgi:hypothetical protein